MNHDGRSAEDPDGTDAATAEDRVEKLLKLGLRNRWYGVAASHQVTEEPVGVTRLGERPVLWRDGDGIVRAVEDRCPHRGIALSIGSVANGNLRCRYRGVEVDKDGVVLRVPAFPDCPMVGHKMIGSFPTFEHYLMVWAYFGDDEPWRANLARTISRSERSRPA